MADRALALGEDYPEIRAGVRKICEGFPGAYWRELDERQEYPDAFVKALTEAGYLAALFPRVTAARDCPCAPRARSSRRFTPRGCNAAACHAQIYVMGTLLRHGSEDTEAGDPAEDRVGRIPAAGFWRHRAVDRYRHDADSRPVPNASGDHYVVTGQKVWTSRALQSDLMLLLARTTPADEVQRRGDGLSVFLVDIRASLGRGLEIQEAAGDDQSQHHRAVLRRAEGPGRNLIGEEGKGFRYILDGMNAERILIASEALGDARWFIRTATNMPRARIVFERPIGQNQGVQFPIARAFAETRSGRSHGTQSGGAVR